MDRERPKLDRCVREPDEAREAVAVEPRKLNAPDSAERPKRDRGVGTTASEGSVPARWRRHLSWRAGGKVGRWGRG